MEDTFNNGKRGQVSINSVEFCDEGEETDGDGGSGHDGENSNGDMNEQQDTSNQSSGGCKENNVSHCSDLKYPGHRMSNMCPAPSKFCQRICWSTCPGRQLQDVADA